MTQEDPATTPGSDSARTTHTPLVGVRGWLAFYCTVLIVLNPLVTFYSFFSTQQGIEMLRTFDRDSAKVVEDFTLFFGVPSFALPGFGVIAGILLIKRSRNAVMIAKIHTAAVPTISVLAMVAAFGFPGSPEIQGKLIHGSVLGVIKSLGYFAIWFTYLCRSRRVQDTYRGDSLNFRRSEAGTAILEGHTVISITEPVQSSPHMQETPYGKKDYKGKAEEKMAQASTGQPTPLDLGNPQDRTKLCMYFQCCPTGA